MEEQLDPLAEQIISLLVFDYARPYRDIENDTTSGILYDSDHLNGYSFTLTARGITYLENNLKVK